MGPGTIFKTLTLHNAFTYGYITGWRHVFIRSTTVSTNATNFVTGSTRFESCSITSGYRAEVFDICNYSEYIYEIRLLFSFNTELILAMVWHLSEKLSKYIWMGWNIELLVHVKICIQYSQKHVGNLPPQIPSFRVLSLHVILFLPLRS